MSAPLYSSSAPLFEAGGVSGSTPIAGGHAAGAPKAGPTGQSVNVIDPATGETYGLDAAFLPEALAKGFKVESAEHAGIRRYVDENKGLSGDAKVFFRGLLDEATFGVADPLIDANRDPYELAQWGALKEAHTGANIAGRVGGFIGSLAYGGEVFDFASHAGTTAARLLGREAIEHGAARALAAEAAYRAPAIAAHEAKRIGSGAAAKILQASADMGTQGLVLSSPKAMAQLITGDPERAAETWVWGAGGGAALGAIGGTVSHFAGGTASKLLPAGEATAGEPGFLSSKLRKFGDEQAISSLELTKPYTKKLTRMNAYGDAAAIVEKRGLGEFAGNPAGRMEALSEALGDVGGKMGAILETTGDRAMIGLDDLEKAAAKVLTHEGGDKLGRVGATEAARDWWTKEFMTPAVIMSEKSGGLSLVDGHKIRIALGKASKWDTTVPNAVNELRKDLYAAVDEVLSAKIDAASKEIGRDLLPEWKALNREYAVTKVLYQGTQDRVSATMANSRHGLFGFIGNQVGATVGGFVGGGAGSLIGGAVGGEATNMLRRYGPSYLSRGAHALADRLEGRGLAALETAHAEHADQLAHIPQALAGMSSGKTVERSKTIGASVLGKFLGINANEKLDDNKALLVLADRLTELVNDPQRATELAHEAVDPIVGDTPDIAVTATTKLIGSAQYLDQVRPKPPAPASPFEPPAQWTPNAAQMADFRTRVKTVLDPYSAIDALTNGSLTKAHVETLQAVAPRLYGEMVKRISEFAMSGKAQPMPYAERLRLSLLTGAPLDRSLAQIAGYQQVFAQQAAAAKKPGAVPQLPAPEVSAVERISAG